jgi:hypothetical protein
MAYMCCILQGHALGRTTLFRPAGIRNVTLPVTNATYIQCVAHMQAWLRAMGRVRSQWVEELQRYLPGHLGRGGHGPYGVMNDPGMCMPSV